MTATPPENEAATNLEGKTLLLPGKVNLVGESHDVSGPRQDREKEFVTEMMGPGAGYWTEYKFQAKDAGQGERSADPMEYRGAQATAELLFKFGGLCDIAKNRADEVKTVGDDAKSLGDAVSAVMRFFQDLKDFWAFRAKMANSWDRDQVSDSDESRAVLGAVDMVWEFFGAKVNDFLTNMDTAQNNPTERLRVIGQIGAIRTLGDSGDDLPALSEQLSAAVGSEGTDSAGLADEINAMRSKRMAEEAASSGLAGVWKVGDIHIEDLMKGRAGVDTSGINVVTGEDFERAFKEWEGIRHPQQTQQPTTS
jgi:hypothetical protein